MAEATPQFAALHDQNMAALGTIMTMFMSDAKTVSKAADYQYLRGQGMVDLEEALGAREVGSRVNPAGPYPASVNSPAPPTQ